MAKAYYATKISPHRGVTDEGFLICSKVPVARTGDQFYLDEEIDYPDKTKVEKTNGGYEVFRPPEEVFNEETVASFEGKPVTNEHPDETVTSENHKRYVMGFVKNVEKGTGDFSDFILADLIIYDKRLIDEITNGKNGVSAGYSCTYDIVDGKLVQRDIICNHIAIVQEGRAGTKAKIRDENRIKKEKTMPDEVKEKVEETKEEEKKDEAVECKKDSIEEILAKLSERLDAIEAKFAEKETSGLDALEEEIFKKKGEKESDEETQTVEPEKVEKIMEERVGDSAVLNLIRAIKPVVAKIKDTSQRKMISDEMAKSIKQILVNDKPKTQPTKTVYDSLITTTKQVEEKDYYADIFNKYRGVK